jgi:hypothetical protein
MSNVPENYRLTKEAIDFIPLAKQGYVRAIHKNWTVTAYRPNASFPATSVQVVGPNGKAISCLRRGTHINLHKLPKYVLRSVEQLTGWTIKAKKPK